MIHSSKQFIYDYYEIYQEMYLFRFVFVSFAASSHQTVATTEEAKDCETSNASAATATTATTTELQTNMEIANKEKKCDESVVTAAPSAPVFDEIAAVCDVKTPVHYPDLQTMLKQEERTTSGLKQKTRERITMKPFNERQLKELYHNPELTLADSFESEFISTELSCTYKDHPLYELLKRYSQNRYNLKINMLDLHSFKRSFEENSAKVWRIEKRELNYSGTCADGERIFKREIYDFAVLNETMFQNASTNLSNTLNLVCCNYMTNLYGCETLKLQV